MDAERTPYQSLIPIMNNRVFHKSVQRSDSSFPNLLTTPMRPSLTGMTLPISTSMASVPASIRSSLVTTASVLLPGQYQHIPLPAYHFKSAYQSVLKCPITNLQTAMIEMALDIVCFLPSGSTSRATLRASEVAMSVLAAVTAKMIQLGLEMCFRIRSLIWTSISLG